MLPDLSGGVESSIPPAARAGKPSRERAPAAGRPDQRNGGTTPTPCGYGTIGAEWVVPIGVVTRWMSRLSEERAPAALRPTPPFFRWVTCDMVT